MKRMHYTFENSGKPVVLLLHGFLGSRNQWDVMLPYFHGYDVLQLELPGHGDSPSCDHYSIDDLALEIHQLLTSIEVDKVHFVSHSMGGYVGCAFAKAYPHQLHSLTLINSIAGADTVAKKQLRNRAIQLIDRFQETYVSMAISNLFAKKEHELYNSQIAVMKQQAKIISLASVLAALRAMRDRRSTLDDVRELNLPITYIYGSLDTVIDPQIIEKEIFKLKATGINVEAGHMLLITHPLKVIQNMHFIE